MTSSTSAACEDHMGGERLVAQAKQSTPSNSRAHQSGGAAEVEKCSLIT